MTFIYPNWRVPKGIHALTTTRRGGVSVAPYDSLNVGLHVKDDPIAVQTNRQILQRVANLPHSPHYLDQIHSTEVVRLPVMQAESGIKADAVYTDQANQVCLVMTADCLPVLFCSQDGKEVAAAHAGWRGLCDGVLEQTISQFKCDPCQIIAWLGPAISQKAFQVGEAVLAQFCAVDPEAEQAFCADPNNVGKFFADLYLLARQRLNKAGVMRITGGEHCTYTQKELFFSYRREQQTGRMATLIWRESMDLVE